MIDPVAVLSLISDTQADKDNFRKMLADTEKTLTQRNTEYLNLKALYNDAVSRIAPSKLGNHKELT